MKRVNKEVQRYQLRSRTINVELHETVKPAELPKKPKKKNADCPETADICKPFNKIMCPLINIKESTNSKSSGPSVQSNSSGPGVKAMLENPPVKPGFCDKSVNSKLSDKSAKSKPNEPSLQLDPGNPSVEHILDDLSMQSKTHSSVNIEPENPSVKFKLLKPSKTIKSVKHKLTVGAVEELAILNKKDIETDPEQSPLEIIDQFIATRKHQLIIIHKEFIAAKLFNSTVEKLLRIENVIPNQNGNPEDVYDWHRFHDYWDRFKHKFSIMTVKLNYCFPGNETDDTLQNNAQISMIEVHHSTNVHFPRTKDEFDNFLSTLIEVQSILENILSIYYAYFDGIRAHNKDHLLPRYLLTLHLYLSPLRKKLKIEVCNFKRFEKRVWDK